MKLLINECFVNCGYCGNEFRKDEEGTFIEEQDKWFCWACVDIFEARFNIRNV